MHLNKEQFVRNEKNIAANLGKQRETLKEDIELYLMTTGVTQEVQKKALLLHLAEENVMEIYKTHKESDAEQ